MPANLLPATCTIRILQFEARVAGPDELARALQALYPSLPSWLAGSGTRLKVNLRVQSHPLDPGRYQVVRPGRPALEIGVEHELLPAVEWAINTEALALLGRRYLLLHAGAVGCAGRGLLLPAASGCGKTVLVAALLRAGFAYLSDEVAALDPASGRLLPFAKSLCLKRGGRQALLSRYPELGTMLPHCHRGGELVWYLRPPEGVLPAAPLPVRHLILPRYTEGARTALVPIARSQALATILQQSFNLGAHGASGIGRMVELLRGAECHALTIGDLDRAVDLVREVAAATAPASTSAGCAS